MNDVGNLRLLIANLLPSCTHMRIHLHVCSLNEPACHLIYIKFISKCVFKVKIEKQSYLVYLCHADNKDIERIHNDSY